MKCNAPFVIDDREVPCGRCHGCRINRVDTWTTRLLHESSEWIQKSFVTLTYDETHLPEDNSVHKEHLQLFFKRLRFHLDKKLRYFACGEYGEHTERPHYHAIIFGVDPILHRNDIESVWSMGRTQTGTVEHASIRYTVGYIMKKAGGKLGDSSYLPRKAPFQLTSQSLGLEWAEKNREYLEQDYSLTVNGKKKPIPAYYVKKLELNKDELKKRALEANDDLNDEYEKRSIYGEDKYQIRQKARLLREQTIIAKENLFAKEKI